MATEQSVSITLGRLMFTTRIAAASTPTTTDGSDRGLRPRLHVRERVGEREVVVAGHGEHEPDRTRVNGQGADKHGEDHPDEQEHAQPGPEHILDEKRQAATDPAQLRVRRDR